MRISAILRRELIVCNLDAKTKEDVFDELCQLIEDNSKNISAKMVKESLIERERKGPFSIMKNIAMPHARISTISQFKIAFATLENEIDFQYPKDADKIKVVILFVIPPRYSNLYLYTISWFLSFFSNYENYQKIIKCSSPDEVIEIIDGHPQYFKEFYTVRNMIDYDEKNSMPDSSTIKEIIEKMRKDKTEYIAIVNDNGEFVGEVSSRSLMKLGVKDYLLLSSNLTYIGRNEIFDNYLVNYGDIPVKNLPQIIHTPMTVQEDEQVIDVVTRLLSISGSTHIYVLKNRKFVNVITISKLLGELTGIYGE